MSIYNNSLVKYVMPLADKLMGTEFIGYLSLIEKMSHWSKDEINAWQNAKLKELFLHAYHNSIYYKRIFDQHGINPLDVKQLQSLPILRKSDIINNFNELVAVNIKNIKYKISATGGSTGDPLQFYLDYRAKSFTTACSIYYWNKLGYKYGEKYIALGSSSLLINKKASFKHQLYNKIRGRIPLNGINLSDEVLKTYTNIIIRNKIKYIYGYSSAIYLLAHYTIENKIPIKHVKACFSTSEILTEKYKNTIEAAFTCIILDCYGASDGGVMAFGPFNNVYEVCYNSMLFIHEEFELNTGKLICTDLFNYAMPFINYEIGDEVKLNCSSNKSYNGQTIEKIYGRTSDVFRLANGRVLTGPGFTVLFKDVNVVAYKIKLINTSSIDIEIKRNAQYSAANETTIISSFKKHAGDDCKIIINYVDEIPKLLNGKLGYFLT